MTGINQRVVLLNLPTSRSVDIEFSELSYATKRSLRGGKKKILKGVNGTFRSGQLSAIMGPSGAGKSTLLNILTGFEGGNWDGEICYIGQEGKKTWREYKKQSCYIQQDDKLHPLFTVLEAMRMAANLKIGSSLSRKARDMLIDDVLENLDLMRSKGTRCGQLSGGQKKRLSIALEMVDNPPVMFLDEPTTGLDALSSHQCIALLQSLARTGRTIVCTIHQPSAAIFEMFDNVYLLVDGKCLYDGATKNMVDYFASVGLQCPKYHNPADFMIEVVTKEYGDYTDQLEKLASNGSCWRTPVANTQKLEEKCHENKATVLIHAPSETERFFVLIRRCLVQLFRDWTVTYLKMLLHAFVGIMLGVLFTESGCDGSKAISNVSFFLVTSVYMSYTSMMPAVLKFPSEFPTLKKEKFNNWYQLRTYYAATTVCSIPLQMISAFIYCVASYFLSCQLLEPRRFFMFLLVTFLVNLISESYGLLIGTLMNPIDGTFTAAITTCAMLALAGFLALYSHMPRFLYYLSYISYFKYSMHAYVHSLYGFDREKLSCSEMYCHYRVPSTILEELSMADGRYWIDIVILSSGLLLYKCIAYCTLKNKLSSA
nr:ATP-binding cassette sub-family G member 4-like [Megalopta genalis]XP_033335895.1 ATP-binding cassette sub-family G member 4-like [Megalopta genalis]XP_033335897.1 ATP-binding cassette sub-family G member 4-like [Megalopta genalis]